MVYANPYSKYIGAGLGTALLGLQPSGVSSRNGFAKSYGGGRSTVRSKKRKRGMGLSAMVKGIVNGMSETKHFTATLATNVLHGNLYSYCFTTHVVQGNAEGQREADAITLSYLKVRMLITTAAASAGFTYRVIVCYNHQEVDPAFVTAGGLVSADVFFPNNAGTDAFAVTNPKACSVLYDAYVDVNSLVAATSDIVSHCFTVSLKDVKFPYVAAGNKYGKYKNLFLVVVPYINGGVVNTTAAGNVSFNFDFAYKDHQ